MEKITAPKKDTLKAIFEYEKDGLFTNEQKEFFFKKNRLWYAVSDSDLQQLVKQMKSRENIQTEPVHAQVVKE